MKLKIRQQSPEELSRQLAALEIENARLVTKMHALEANVLPTIYKILSQRKNKARKKKK